MKKIINKFCLLVVVVLSLVLIYPTNLNASSEQIVYVKINDNTRTLTYGNLSFSNITFKEYSSNSVQKFGLTGEVNNSSSETINYTSTVYYYDSNYSLIAQGYNSGNAVTGKSNFNQMSDLTILNGHNISEIYYYSLSINNISNSSTELNTVSTTPSKNNKYNFYDYVIDKYDINILVNENNTLDITETITAYFNVAKHGIFRTIPLKNTVKRLDGTTSINRAQITNLSVNNEYTTSRENGNYKIQIGSANRTLTGEQTYVIKYTYNLGKDPVKNYDELYYNIIGNEWDTVIGNITFTITMPKEFDSGKIGFSSGKKGSTNNSKVKYNVSGNEITGYYNDILKVGEGLTIRCELDNGYFVGAGLSNNIIDYIILLVPIIFLGISILIWYKFGRDNKVVETVEFYPPEGFNSLEVGFLYKGKADNQDVTSLLIYLANKGYIKISEIEEKSSHSKSNGFKITKLKEYDGNNINEQTFLKGLFKKNDNEVTSEDLYNHFYVTMKKILSNINNKKNKNKIFESLASSKSKFIILMIIATFSLIIIPLNYERDLILAFISTVIGFAVMFNMSFNNRQIIYSNDMTYSPALLIKKILVLVFGFSVGVLPLIFIILPTLSQDPIHLIEYIICVVCALGMIICLKYLPKRTQYGNEILGKIKGFKNFLETAEKDKLEAMVMENPTYFYNILPYTYALGVSNAWIKKFETILLQEPSWYNSKNTFNMSMFREFMNTTMSSVQTVMSSTPPSNFSSGGSSGGGSSGGGSGGGGGGSW